MPSLSAPVLIGVLASSGSLAGSWTAGARAAADMANRSGGIHGRPVVIQELKDSDPWKSGAGLLARLLDEPGLAALVGAAEGASAHVAAQVATRRRVPVVLLSPEESLTEAGDPWVFRAVPDDAQQARLLLEWAGAKGKRAVLVVPEGREGRERRKSLAKACRDSGVTVAPEDGDILMLWLDHAEARRWFTGSGQVQRPRRILASLRLADEAFLEPAPAGSEGLAMPMLSLRDAAYDAVMAVVLAARLKGTAPGAVRDGLAAGGLWKGKSGTFRFDAKGNRDGPLQVGELRQGRLSPSSSGPARP